MNRTSALRLSCIYSRDLVYILPPNCPKD